MNNKNFAKLISETEIEYAPRVFKTESGVIVPNVNDDEFFFSRGYYKVIDNIPHYDTSKEYITVYAYRQNDEKHTITVVYEVKNIESKEKKTTQTVKRYSKLKVTLFCIEQGIWNTVKEYLEKIGYYDLFVMAQFFLETDEYFNKGLQMYAETMVSSGASKDDLDMLIENMKNFAYDGDVIVNEEGRVIGL